MNQEKIGLFIKKLREDNNMTQEELAEKIPISRQAISKWERGVSIPDSQTLIRLSEIFKVTINEILSGEKENQNNKDKIEKVALAIYDDRSKSKKIAKILLFFLIIIIILFLTYYFLTSYKSIKVYTITGIGKRTEITNGIFVRTNEKLFFRVGEIIKDNSDDEILNLELYYKDSKNNKKEIISTDDDNVLFIDYMGYNDYFDTSKIDYIIKNMYLEVKYNNYTEEIKLDFVENYVNDNIFIKNSKNISNFNDNKIQYKISIEDTDLINKIKKNYTKVDSEYLYTVENDDITEKIYYYEDINVIKVLIQKLDTVEEMWIYEINDKVLDYQNLKNNKSYLFENGKSNCENCSSNELENILNTFYRIVNNSVVV